MSDPIKLDSLKTLVIEPELPENGVKLKSLLAQVEASLIKQAMLRHKNNKAKAARTLGLNRTTLVEKLKRLKE